MAASPGPQRWLTGADLCRLMRRHHVTIRALAQRMGIPMTRVRQVRTQGLQDPHAARDWLEAITGEDPGPMQAPHEAHARGRCSKRRVL